MNKKIYTLNYLVESTKEQLSLLEIYNAEKEVNSKAWMYCKKPSKQSIKDNLKLIRRVALEIEKELKENEYERNTFKTIND